MKVVIATESPVDEAAIRVLVQGVLETVALPADRPPYGIRSWPGLLDVVKAVFLDAYYQTDADGLVLVADSDNSPLHEPTHGGSTEREKNCRLCLLRNALADASRSLKPRPGRVPFRTAVGLTVPEISAWYLDGVKPGINEAAWVNGLKQKKPPYSKPQLKRWAFGRDYLASEERIRIATEHANRLAARLDSLEQAFPVGFGSLANDLRSWPR